MVKVAEFGNSRMIKNNKKVDKKFSSPVINDFDHPLLDFDLLGLELDPVVCFAAPLFI